MHILALHTNTVSRWFCRRARRIQLVNKMLECEIVVAGGSGGVFFLLSFIVIDKDLRNGVDSVFFFSPLVTQKTPAKYWALSTKVQIIFCWQLTVTLHYYYYNMHIFFFIGHLCHPCLSSISRISSRCFLSWPDYINIL